MCEAGGADRGAVQVGERKLAWMDTSDLLAVANLIAEDSELRRTAAGFVGYGSTTAGDRVLMAVDSHYDLRVVDAVATALRQRGASVDVMVADAGPDREFSQLDEIRTVIRDVPWEQQPRRWEGLPWVEELAVARGYDLLVHGKGGGIPQTPHRYEAFPWLQVEHFASTATTYPRPLHVVINNKLWSMFSQQGRGGRVTLTDPEGTELRYTLFDDYFDGTRRGYADTPWWGHVMAHGPTPIVPQEDAEGIVRGTMNHFSRPFPGIELELRGGRVERVGGGGDYGRAWAELHASTSDTKYPCFPRPGLFWLWEVAIGTNPKIRRPADIRRHSSGGFEWERRRSGVIHMGFGTRWRGAEERWAGANGIAYGHLHVHLLFPTLVIDAPDGQRLTVIDHGRLTALDDPEVRALAGEYGDPDEVLAEDWIPDIPGISAPGDYADYAADPASFIYGA
ncbi:MAG: hypothetical protein ACRDU8_00370 [Egibacteraceae bacterium]